MTRDPAETPLLGVGGQLFTIVLCAEVHPPELEELEDDAISTARDDDETVELLSLAEDVAAETEGETDLVNAVLVLRADDLRHAEVQAHRALQSVFAQQQTAFIRISTMAAFPGNVSALSLAEPLVTEAAALANPAGLEAVEELPSLFDVT